ncbi:MAG: YkgJ family cysteine cluster protein, partial [Desulforhabdus sp.]|nr:YkgJ family cysteine cluster protein [Desulforhabdus sp.]
MSSSEQTLKRDDALDYPASWDAEKLRQNWLNHMLTLIKENETPIPLKRLQYQLEQSTAYHDIMHRWPTMDAGHRLKAWKILMEYSEQAVRDLLPTCVQCGECCRKGSPTLLVADLELLSQNTLDWNQLITLREGEPVRSPIKEEIFYLLDERIKVREKPGTQECVFLDSSTDRCTIYVDRPLQCRAQACW